jgi:hypothetical protein
MSDPTGGSEGAFGHCDTGVGVQAFVLSKAIINIRFVALYFIISFPQFGGGGYALSRQFI